MILSSSAGLAATAAQPHAAAIALASHRAVYDLSLSSSRQATQMSVRGRILYEFTASPCAGYTTDVRQVTELDSSEAAPSLTDLRTSTWENSTGDEFRFSSTNFVDRKEEQSVDGEARRTAGGIEVTLRKPAVKTFRVDRDVVFPTDQLRRIIVAARAGRKLLQLTVFDGSETGERVYDTLAVIGSPILPGQQPSDAAADQSALADLTRWPVRVSYFETGGTGEQTPIYGIAFELYENGISRRLVLDYNDFEIAGPLTRLEIKPSPACN